MKINRLKLQDKPIFEELFHQQTHSLSSFSFVNIFIWRDFFDFFWTIIEDNLCLFAKNNIGCFMYLPPLGRGFSNGLIDKCFKIMDKENLNQGISRIENIEQETAAAFKKLDLNLKKKDSEYIYKTKNLIVLSGNTFKSKRSACNYFIKNYDFKYCEFGHHFKNDCIGLYKNWCSERQNKCKDTIYQSMLEDNSKIHSRVFDYYQRLGLISRVVVIKDEVKAYSFGFKLNKHTFCILLEVADLSFKGLAQFIFREFVQEMSEYKFINVMDDSGLENIKRTKLSYHPYKLIPSYIATRS